MFEVSTKIFPQLPIYIPLTPYITLSWLSCRWSCYNFCM